MTEAEKVRRAMLLDLIDAHRDASRFQVMLDNGDGTVDLSFDDDCERLARENILRFIKESL